MSIPHYFSPNMAKGTAVVPSPQPRSKTRSGVVHSKGFDECLPGFAHQTRRFFVKSPFSHSALFRVIVESFPRIHFLKPSESSSR